jgi:hypothetical protein
MASLTQKLTFNETTYEFHYYEPNGKPAYNLQVNGEITKFNLVYDVDGDMEGFNLYEEVRYQHRLLSHLWIPLPSSLDDSYTFSLRKVFEIFTEIQTKTGDYKFLNK